MGRLKKDHGIGMVIPKQTLAGQRAAATEEETPDPSKVRDLPLTSALQSI